VNPQYRKPPITEAILDLRVEPRPGASAAELLAGLADLSDTFPRRQELPFEQNFLSGAGVASGFSMTFGNLPAPVVLGGFRYQSADGRRVLQARHNGFVFSFIGTEAERYPGWDNFRAEANALWERYVRAWGPVAVVRVALRFVNRFPMPTPGSGANDAKPEAQEYLRTLNIPRPNLTPVQGISGFSLQLVLPQTDIEAVAVVNNALETLPGVRPELASLLLDIDVFREGISLAPDDDALWRSLETLRNRKNELFRAFITDAVERTLEPVT